MDAIRYCIVRRSAARLNNTTTTVTTRICIVGSLLNNPFPSFLPPLCVSTTHTVTLLHIPNNRSCCCLMLPFASIDRIMSTILSPFYLVFPFRKKKKKRKKSTARHCYTQSLLFFFMFEHGNSIVSCKEMILCCCGGGHCGPPPPPHRQCVYTTTSLDQTNKN